MEEQAEYKVTQSDSIKALTADLIKAQMEMKNPAFDAVNPHFKSKYASLVSVRAATLPVFNKHNFAVVQVPTNNAAGDVGVITKLLHASGEWLEGALFIKAKQDGHGAGSAITYARRYSLQAMAGVVGDEDDDGKASLPNGKPNDTITPEQVKEITELIAETNSDNERFWTFAGATTVDQIPSHNYQKVVSKLKQKAEQG